MLHKILSSHFPQFGLSLTMANVLKCHGLFVRCCQQQTHDHTINISNCHQWFGGVSFVFEEYKQQESQSSKISQEILRGQRKAKVNVASLKNLSPCVSIWFLLCKKKALSCVCMVGKKYVQSDHVFHAQSADKINMRIHHNLQSCNYHQ